MIDDQSGGPPMTVKRTFHSDGQAFCSCAWFTDAGVQEHSFPIASLKLANPVDLDT